MSRAIETESAPVIAARMDLQRAQLHRQFAKSEAVASFENDLADSALPTLQPHQPRSFLMKLLIANPHLLQRLLILGVSTALGARYSSWAMRLVGLFLAARKR